MSRILPRSKKQRLRDCEERYAALKAEVENLDFVCVGSLNISLLTCGKAGCACHTDPAKRHGPYPYWTRKVAGKTVSVLLKKEEVPIFRAWIENSRKLDRLVRQMRQVSARVIKLTTGRKI